MSRYIVTFLSIFFASYNSYAQGNWLRPKAEWTSPEYRWGVGVHAGNPSGISVKRYLFNEFAFEMIFGTPVFWFYDQESHFNKRFYDKEFIYKRHTFPFSGHIRLLKHHAISNKLKYFYGGGIQSRSYVFKYYDETMEEDGQMHYLAIGPEALTGVEYNFRTIPLVIYADIGIYMEIVDNPLKFQPIGGIGLRYIWGYWFENGQ